MNLLILKFVHSRNVFPDDVELDVDDGSFFDGMEVGVVEGVGDDADLEGVGCGTTYGEAHAVDGHASLIDGEIAVLDHLLRALVFEGVLMAALLILDGNANCSLVNVSLHDMAVKSAVHQHRALHVHFVAHLEQSEVAALQSLAHSGDGICVAFEAHDCQANAVVGDALVDAKFLNEGTGEGQMYIILFMLDGDHSRHTFNYSGKHMSCRLSFQGTNLQNKFENANYLFRF